MKDVLEALDVLLVRHHGRICTMAYLRGPGSEAFEAAIAGGLIEKRRDCHPLLDPWGPFSLYATDRGRAAHEAHRAAQAARDVQAPAPVAPPLAPVIPASLPQEPAPAAAASDARIVTAEDLAKTRWKVTLFGDTGGRNAFWLQRRECVEHPALTREDTGPRGRSKHEPTTDWFVDGMSIAGTRTAIAAALTAFYAGELVGPPDAADQAPALPSPPAGPRLAAAAQSSLYG